MENHLIDNATSPFRVLSADFSEVDDKREAITLPVKLELPRFAARSGM